ncbi:unnamed protein product [Cercospora beticola]|nr:unnamed protein product [Cercospora beticola]
MKPLFSASKSRSPNSVASASMLSSFFCCSRSCRLGPVGSIEGSSFVHTHQVRELDALCVVLLLHRDARYRDSSGGTTRLVQPLPLQKVMLFLSFQRMLALLQQAARSVRSPNDILRRRASRFRCFPCHISTSCSTGTASRRTQH